MKNNVIIPRIPFYFVLHGKTNWNSENKVMGQIDIPLNEVGLEQAHIVAKNISHIQISPIVSSPLKRAMQIAEIISANFNRPLTVIDELTQNALGFLEGRNKEDVVDGKTIGTLIEQWRMGAYIPGVEQWADFVARIHVGLNRALASKTDVKPIVIVAHKPVYWALSHILNAHVADIHAKNCGVYLFTPPDLDSHRWLIHELGNE